MVVEWSDLQLNNHAEILVDDSIIVISIVTSGALLLGTYADNICPYLSPSP